MRDPDYLSELDSGHNIAVLTGERSGHLNSIDIDCDEAVEPFLALNPALAGTLRSRGQRGCNFWVRMSGAYPPTSRITSQDNSPWGEFRSTGACTMIDGLHPAGMNYVRYPEVAPITTAFEDIVWPDDLVLPWLTAPEELPGTGDESDDLIIEQHGPPVSYSTNKDGERRVNRINEGYWAGLYAAENTTVFDPNENAFFRYDEGTGLYSEISSDAIKQTISKRILYVSRQNEGHSELANLREDRILSPVVSQLRGITENRGAFADRIPVVHLENCVLHFEGTTCFREDFSPGFRSRNRSPIPFDEAADCPRFLNELILPAVHPEDAVLLQKMAGQFILGDNPTQRFLVLDGESGRGKSQFADVMQELVGRQNVTQLRTGRLDDRFELYRYLRKTLIAGVDVDADFLSNKGASNIKGLVGGDWFDAEQKGGTGSFPFQGKFNIIMTSNSRLKVRLQGDVGAWRRRILIVRFESPPPQRRIPGFGALLVREEGSGILNWALRGLGLLLADIEETGDIRLTQRQTDIVDSLLAESDSLRFFLRDSVECHDNSSLTVDELTQRYARYCPEHGWDPLPNTVITRQLPTLMLELFQTVRANDCGRNGRSVRGLPRTTSRCWCRSPITNPGKPPSDPLAAPWWAISIPMTMTCQSRTK